MYAIAYPSGTISNDGVVIPQDDRTPEYQAYAAWLAQGNGPEQMADATPALPRITVSAWQIRKALNKTDLRDAVEAAVAASGNLELQDGWRHSPEFYSDNPLTLGMGAALGKSSAEMYALFQFAESL
jgi:hypothetical protein